MRNVDHVGRLRVIKLVEVCVIVGADDLVGQATTEDHAPVGIEANVLVTELQHICLSGAELERNQTSTTRRCLGLIDEPAAGTLAGRTVNARQEVLQMLAPLAKFLQIDAPLELGRQFPCIERIEDRTRLRHVSTSP